ncbi:hypothetical protein [Anatilimnocola floriformis]|uniref:hypothetical protein n=1 Tax=Anatilimnocola floriformis TaxID=2948575 RepID=UPI0020C1E9A2|nr:hypothetical protein [Anatilimnocola floriformis]
MLRYEWKKVADDLYQLIDSISRRPIASVQQQGERWHWIRNTTVKLQGAPAGEGDCETLELAQAAVLAGLPNQL